MADPKLYDPNTLIDINEKKGLPRSYHFSLPTRLTILLFSILVCAYAVYYLLTRVANSSDATMFAKLVPIIIFFAGLNTLSQNIFNIHTLTLTQDKLIAKSLINIKRKITWSSITKISMSKSKKRYVIITYMDEKNRKKEYNLMLVFKDMIEILNSIGELAKNAKYDEFMTSIIVSAEVKKEAKAENSNEK
ncbi:MAG: hypothetical protein WC155_03155 [Candidatus Cloacimonadales bacterium]